MQISVGAPHTERHGWSFHRPQVMNGACARDVRMRDARTCRPWQAESARKVPAYQPVHAMAEPACSPQLSPPARRTHAGAQPARMPVCATQAPCENVITLSGASGGAGTTTLAAMLTRELAKRENDCAIVDADVRAGGGGLDVLLGIEHESGSRWHDIHAPLGELDGEALRRRLPHGLEIEHVPALVEASHIVVAELTVLGLARAKAHIEWLRRNGERNVARAQEPPRPGEEWKPIVGVPGHVIGVLCVEPPAVAKGRGAVSLEEARKYLQMEHMECELMGPVRSDARLCGDILEGLGIRRVHRRNARVLGGVAEMVERACGIGGR